MENQRRQPPRPLLQHHPGRPETTGPGSRTVRPDGPGDPKCDATGMRRLAMLLWNRLVWKLKNGWRRSILHRELEEEMRFHVELLEQEQRQSGAGGIYPSHAARREFGNVGLLMEDSRSA